METPLETAQHSLNLIHQMIKDKKKQMGKSAIHYLLWGTSVSLAAFIHYFLLTTGHLQPWLPWPILMSISGIIAITVGYKQNQQQPIKSWIDRAADALWLSFAICILICIGATATTGNWKMAYTFLLSLYGLGLFVSGSILSFTPFKLGGILNWILAVVSLKLDFPELLLVIALAMIGGYLVPGLLLLREEKRNEV